MEDQIDRLDVPAPGNGERPESSFIRKASVGIAGGVVTAAGVVMLVTPGPGLLVTFAGLGILGREFPAVQRRLHRLRDRLRGAPDPDDES